MIALVLSVLSLASSSAAKEGHHTSPNVAAVASPTNHPWYVKAASQEIVNFCCLGGMMAGWGSGGGYSTVGGGNASPTLVSISEQTAFTYTTSSATTLYTTIPGGVITIYGSAGSFASTLDDVTLSSVVTPTPAPTDDLSTDDSTDTATPTDPITTTSTFYTTTTTHVNGFFAEVERIESFAHALADAIIAPREMTALLSSAYDAIVDHGYIHATQAVQLLSQADQGLKALQTDPAYAKQRKALEAQPTPVNYKKAVAAATSKHAAGLAKLVAEPSGSKVLHMAKELGEKFIKDFTE